MRVFVDCDGVLADFDKRAIEILGHRPRDFEGKEGADAMWEQIDAYPDFFYSLEPLADAHYLWNSIIERGHDPIVLTGTPRWTNKKMRSPTEQKVAWVQKHFGHDKVITCKSKDKCLHMEQPGDVLIDDWHKYIPQWEAKGGVFILHENAEKSLRALDAYVAQLALI